MVNAIPQIAMYGLFMMSMLKDSGFDVKCVQYNHRGAWLYDPVEMIRSVTRFMHQNRRDVIMPWEVYLDELGEILDINLWY